MPEDNLDNDGWYVYDWEIGLTHNILPSKIDWDMFC